MGKRTGQVNFDLPLGCAIGGRRLRSWSYNAFKAASDDDGGPALTRPHSSHQPVPLLPRRTRSLSALRPRIAEQGQAAAAACANPGHGVVFDAIQHLWSRAFASVAALCRSAREQFDLVNRERGRTLAPTPSSAYSS
jgi:hypothetical protein